MGLSKSSTHFTDSPLPSFQFLCSTWNPVSSLRPAVLQSRRAQELSRLAVAPTLRRTPPLPGHTLTASSTTADQRGARFPGADQSRHDLVSSCASAAKLRGGKNLTGRQASNIIR